MIVFQTVVFQCISQLSILTNICDQIDSRIDLWNKGAYSELVQASQRELEEALGNKRGPKPRSNVITL